MECSLNKSVRTILSISIYRCQNWGSERLSKLQIATGQWGNVTSLAPAHLWDKEAPLPKRTDSPAQRRWGPTPGKQWARGMGPASGVTEGWTSDSSLVGGGVHSENSYVWWQNYRWGPEVVSEHVVRARGKRRRRKVKDIGGCGGSQATQRLSPLLKRPVWNHGACPCLRPPTPFLDEPDGLADLHPLSWSRMSPVLALG